jgi:hypothetical protein
MAVTAPHFAGCRIAKFGSVRTAQHLHRGNRKSWLIVHYFFFLLIYTTVLHISAHVTRGIGGDGFFVLSLSFTHFLHLIRSEFKDIAILVSRWMSPICFFAHPHTYILIFLHGSSSHHPSWNKKDFRLLTIRRTSSEGIMDQPPRAPTWHRRLGSW